MVGILEVGVVVAVASWIVGFLSSHWTYLLQNRSSKREHRNRLRQELQRTKAQLQPRIDKGDFKMVAFHHDYFSYQKLNLVSKMDDETWELVLKAYLALNKIRHRYAQTPEDFGHALEAVNEAINALDG